VVGRLEDEEVRVVGDAVDLEESFFINQSRLNRGAMYVSYTCNCSEILEFNITITQLFL
jgi:hypothetical protein